jgi:thioredoxin-like negative regulator of GroEL
MRISALVLAVAGALPALAAGPHVEWVAGSFDAALARAKAEGRGLMVDVYATWCGPCHLMDRQVYTDPSVAEAARHWIPLKVDGELGDGPKIVERYHVVGYPTVLFLDAEGKEIDRIFGFVDAATFARTMNDYRQGRGTLEEAAQAALAHPEDLQAALDVGTRYAVRGDAQEAYRHFARIFEARARARTRPARVRQTLHALRAATGDRVAVRVTRTVLEDLSRQEEADALDALAAGAYLILGKYLYLRGNKDYRRALQVLRTLEKTFPGSKEAKEAAYHIAVALQRSGHGQEAKKKLMAYLAEEGRSAEAVNTVAWFCFREHAHLTWGRTLARKALEAAPDNAGLWDTLAEIEGALGEWKAALEAERKAAAADPDEPYYPQQIRRFEAAVARIDAT